MVTPPKTTPTQRWNFDVRHVENHLGLIGIDEAGRGCFAGPVVAACVCLKADFYQDKKLKKQCKEFNDSKQTPADVREELLAQLQQWEQEQLLYSSWASASAQEVDQHNIFTATQLAMARALESMMQKENSTNHLIILPQHNTESLPLFSTTHSNGNTTISDSCILDENRAATTTTNTHYKILIDGRTLKKFPHPHQGIIKGDSKSLIIAMASIIAKTQRDRLLHELDNTYPQYGFADHKGYGTPQHQEALHKHGPCEEHRKTYLRKFNTRELQKALLFDEDE